MSARKKTAALLISSLLLLLMTTATLPQITLQQPTQTTTGHKNNSGDSITRKMSPSTSIFWAKSYGGSAWDYATSVQQTSDGGYVVAGSIEYVNVTSHDAWVLKLNSTGSVEWQKAYGGGDMDFALSVQQTSDGGYIVAGRTRSFGAGGSDAWVLKLNSTGGVTWQKTYGGTGWDCACSVQQTSDGGYIVAGITDSFGAGYDDAWVLKLNSTGDVTWQKTYGGTDYDEAYTVQQTSDGGYIVGGGPSAPYNAGPLWVLKLSSAGSAVWQKALSERDGNEAYSVQQTSDGGYIVAGYTAQFGPHGGDAWVLKLKPTGSVEWQKAYAGRDDDSADSVQQTSDGGYIVAGFTSLLDENGLYIPHVWVLKLDSTGWVVWQRIYGGSDLEGASCIQETSDGGYIVAGITDSFGAGATDAWVLKLGIGGDIVWDKGSGASTHATTVTPSDTSANVSTMSATLADSNATAQDTAVTPQDTHATVETQSTPNVTIIDPRTFVVAVGAGSLAVIVVVVAALFVSRRRRM